ncbi:MAG: DUF6165 family protein [Gammaproteobacteria bacterium]|nr:DUF6165 family protein [Gammaproteobacteria bacterium]
MAVTVPVSWGELLDKVTILQIKAERIVDADKLANVNRELAELTAVIERNGPLSSGVQALMDELREANTALWDIEDNIRTCEREKRFDEEFIRLARSVYYTNDRRAELKRKLNQLLDSALVEEKSYESYT